MSKDKQSFPPVALVIVFLTLASFVFLPAALNAQKKKPSTTPILWENVTIAQQDLLLGPGASEMQPDLSQITFIKQETGGFSTKYRIKDGAGNIWVAKVGLEAQPETVAVRLLSAIGYVTEINYLVPSLTIPGKGTFENVRLEARPKNLERGKKWKWGSTPFERTRQMRGLKLMMALINNWDMKTDNNVIIKDGKLRKYVVSDLGASFGSTGTNPLPIVWRIGRSRNNPLDYSRSKFISSVRGGNVDVIYYGKSKLRMRNFTTGDARWLADLLKQLSDEQIDDAFRAANYSQSDIDLLAATVKKRIAELDRAGTRN
ncbi:MAG: hypothetical protein WBD16_09600 [Pyrinomonadaceae bacterium]